MTAPADARAGASRPWTYLLLAAFFGVMGVADLLDAGNQDLPTAIWELTFALANLLFYWVAVGAPRGVRVVAYGVLAVGLVLATRDVFF